MGEQHLNALSVTTRLLERWGLGQRAGNIPGLFMDATRNNAESRPWTALRLEHTAPAVGRTGEITKRLAVVDRCASRRQGFVRRADVNVTLLVEPKVCPAEGPVLVF